MYSGDTHIPHKFFNDGDAMRKENIWESVVCDGVLDTMRLLGCAEEYVSGNASDFEKFREWICAYPFMRGNAEAKKAAEKLRPWVDSDVLFDGRSPSAACLWRAFEGICGGKYTADENLYIPSFIARINKCDEKYIILSDTVDISYALRDVEQGMAVTLGDVVKMLEEMGDEIFCFAPDISEFIRPDRYHAEVEFGNYISDKNNKSIDLNMIYAQIICELIYVEKCNAIRIDVKNGESLKWAESFVKYLSMRGFSVDVLLYLKEDLDIEMVRKICLLSNKKTAVIPAVERSRADYLTALANKIPVSAVART